MNETPFARDEAMNYVEPLVEIGRDANIDFVHSAHQATDLGLKILPNQQAMARAARLDEFQQLQAGHGQAGIDNSGSVTGTLHRAWINLRPAISNPSRPRHFGGSGAR